MVRVAPGDGQPSGHPAWHGMAGSCLPVLPCQLGSLRVAALPAACTHYLCAPVISSPDLSPPARLPPSSPRWLRTFHLRRYFSVLDVLAILGRAPLIRQLLAAGGRPENSKSRRTALHLVTSVEGQRAFLDAAQGVAVQDAAPPAQGMSAKGVAVAQSVVAAAGGAQGGQAAGAEVARVRTGEARLRELVFTSLDKRGLSVAELSARKGAAFVEELARY